jgi:hypothetical protein
MEMAKVMEANGEGVFGGGAAGGHRMSMRGPGANKIME